ncbi:MAG: hypothetical protein AB1458_13270 [Bacteroidota bacterium]
MKPRGNEKVTETPISKLWFEGDILLSAAKRTPRTLGKTMEHFKVLKELLRGRKVFSLVDFTQAGITDREARQYIRMQAPELYKGLAVVSRTQAGKMIAQPYFALGSPDLPIKYFSDVKKAKAWLEEQMRKKSK